MMEGWRRRLRRQRPSIFAGPLGRTEGTDRLRERSWVVREARREAGEQSLLNRVATALAGPCTYRVVNR